MSDHNGKTPAEQAMEVFVYAPIGLLFEGSTLLPQLVERGRNQVTMARMIGKFAVEQGRTEAAKTASKLGDQAAGLLDFLGDSMTPVVEPAAPPATSRPARRPASSGRALAAAKTAYKPGGSNVKPEPSEPATATDATTVEPARSTKAKATKTAKSAKTTAKATKTTHGEAATTATQAAPGTDLPVTAASLAITDYDGLSASHVVNRLGGLSADELEAVRRYESANRGRKTILSKVAQLQSQG